MFAKDSLDAWLLMLVPLAVAFPGDIATFQRHRNARLRVGTKMMLQETIALLRHPRGRNSVSADCRATPLRYPKRDGLWALDALPRLRAASRLTRPSAGCPAGLPEALPTPQDAPMSETLLDMKGMNCPLPVLRANRALRTMAPGERLRILATDRAAVADFQAFCRETGHALLAWSEEGGVFSFVIRRRPDDTEQKDE
jgi:tRNA 2-thiouridine synthesizing protein A